MTALAAGAAAGLKPTVQKVITDAYEGIKALIKRKYQVDLDTPERNPATDVGRSVVKEELEKTDAGHDDELLRQAQAVLKAIRQYAPEAAAAVGVSIEDLEAGASVRISDIVATGAGVIMKNVKAGEDVEIRQVRAGGTGSKT
ncbi:MAG: hypothetical protein ACREMX_02135 [Gemmatimonadales bacterium]